jgi:hypothetical protein
MGRSKAFFFFLNFYTFRGKDENKTQISFSTNSQLGGWVDWLVTRAAKTRATILYKQRIIYTSTN